MAVARVLRRLLAAVEWVAIRAAPPPRHRQCMAVMVSTTIFRSKTVRYIAIMIRHSIWVADFVFWGKS